MTQLLCARPARAVTGKRWVHVPPRSFKADLLLRGGLALDQGQGGSAGHCALPVKARVLKNKAGRHSLTWHLPLPVSLALQFSLGESAGASGGRTGGTIAAVRRGPAPMAPRAPAAAKVPLSRGASLKSGGGSAAVSRTTSASASLEQLEAAHQEAEVLREQVGAARGGE